MIGVMNIVRLSIVFLVFCLAALIVAIRFKLLKLSLRLGQRYPAWDAHDRTRVIFGRGYDRINEVEKFLQQHREERLFRSEIRSLKTLRSFLYLVAFFALALTITSIAL